MKTLNLYQGEDVWLNKSIIDEVAYNCKNMIKFGKIWVLFTKFSFQIENYDSQIWRGKRVLSSNSTSQALMTNGEAKDDPPGSHSPCFPSRHEIQISCRNPSFIAYCSQLCWNAKQRLKLLTDVRVIVLQKEQSSLILEKDHFSLDPKVGLVGISIVTVYLEQATSLTPITKTEKSPIIPY